MEFSELLDKHRSTFIAISVSLLFASTALGVQRTALSLYGNSFLGKGIIIGGAISLSIFGMSKALGNLIGGKLADRNGRKNSSKFGMIFVSVGAFIMASSGTFLFFLIGNSITGFGIGILFAASTISYTDLASAKHRAKGISIMELSVYVGTTIGAIISGPVIENSGFRGAFFAAFLLVLIPWVTVFYTKETKSLAIKEEERPYRSAKTKITDLRDQRKLIEPDVEFSPELIDLIDNYPETERGDELESIAHSDIIFLSMMTGLVSRISDTAIILLFPLIIIQYGSTLLELALITSSFTLAWSLGIAIAGPIGDNIGRKLPLTIGLFIEGFGYLILFNIGLNEWLPTIIIGTIIAGLGRGLYFPIPPSIIADLAPPKKRGSMLGYYRLILDSGYLIGSILLVIIVELQSHDKSLVNILIPGMRVVMILLIVQGILIALLLKDPRPGFRQRAEIRDHLSLVEDSIALLSKGIYSYSKLEFSKAKIQAIEAKNLERKADLLLEKLNRAIYSKTIKESDAVELIMFSNKVDKALGYIIRSLRKFMLLDETPSENFLVYLREYALVLQLLIETTVETFDLMHVRFHLAIQQSYQVNLMEEYLDYIHKELYKSMVEMSNDAKPMSLLLISNAIESLEKGANTLEDAAELLRLISFKH